MLNWTAVMLRRWALQGGGAGDAARPSLVRPFGFRFSVLERVQRWTCPQSAVVVYRRRISKDMPSNLKKPESNLDKPRQTFGKTLCGHVYQLDGS